MLWGNKFVMALVHVLKKTEIVTYDNYNTTFSFQHNVLMPLPIYT